MITTIIREHFHQGLSRDVIEFWDFDQVVQKSTLGVNVIEGVLLQRDLCYISQD